MTHSRAARAAACACMAACLHALAGPVETYRTGPQFCPQDRSSTAASLTEAQAIERARALVPRDFCGPDIFVSGCDAEPEWAYEAWRIFVHQYKLVGSHKERGGLQHTYVILDRVGNCLANIPGTELGARN
jgi:hypothetical protein